MIKRRNSNIELLRIVSIFLIILGHIISNTKWDFTNMFTSYITAIETMWIGAKLGVDIFFLITGYFLISKRKLRINSTIRIWLTVIFYSWMLSLFCIIFIPDILNSNMRSIRFIIRYIFPVTFGSYWFITVYIVLMLLYPLINKFLRNLSKFEFQWILIIGFLYLFICATFLKNLTAGTSIDTFISGLYIYMLGSYIGIYKADFINNKFNFLKHLFIFLLMIVLMICSILVMSLLMKYNFIHYGPLKRLYFTAQNSPFELMASVELLLIFLNTKNFYNYFINKISTTILSVYIIHTHFLFTNFIIPKIINAKKYQYSNILFIYLYCFLWAAGILALLIIVDLIRQYFLNNIEEKLVQYISNKLKRWIIQIKNSEYDT